MDTQLAFLLSYLQRENDFLRERLAKFEGSHLSSNSSTISNGSKLSPNDQNQQHDSFVGDSDDLDSNVSLHSTSSIIAHETVIHEQPKYFDRKRRLLAAEQHLSPTEVDPLGSKKNSPHKKACLDDIVDSLNQKAQAERDEDLDQHEGEREEQLQGAINECEMKQEKADIERQDGTAATDNDDTPTFTAQTMEREEEDEEEIDVDDAKSIRDDHH